MKNKTNSFSFLKKPYFSAFKSNKTKKMKQKGKSHK